MERVEQLHRPVGEPMDLLERELAAVEAAQQAAAAFGPQVQCEIVNGRCHVCRFSPSGRGWAHLVKVTD